MQVAHVVHRPRPHVVVIGLALLAGACGPSALDFEIGECVNLPDGETIEEFETVDCGEVHDGEVFALPTQPGGDDAAYPGEETLDDLAQEECEGERFESYVGTAYPDSALWATSLRPSQESWERADDREVVCLLVGEPLEDGNGFTQLTGSKKDSNE